MKKLLRTILASTLALVLTACSSGGSSSNESSELVVGATVVPHAELLNLVKEDLEEREQQEIEEKHLQERHKEIQFSTQKYNNMEWT